MAELSEKEVNIMQYIADGLSYKSIAERLHTSEQMVKNWCKAIFHKLEAENRAHAVACCLRRQLID